MPPTLLLSGTSPELLFMKFWLLFFQTSKSEIFRLFFFQRDGRPETLEFKIKKDDILLCKLCMQLKKTNQINQPTKKTPKNKNEKKKKSIQNTTLSPQQLARGRRVEFQDTQC